MRFLETGGVNTLAQHRSVIEPVRPMLPARGRSFTAQTDRLGNSGFGLFRPYVYGASPDHLRPTISTNAG